MSHLQVWVLQPYNPRRFLSSRKVELGNFAIYMAFWHWLSFLHCLDEVGSSRNGNGIWQQETLMNASGEPKAESRSRGKTPISLTFGMETPGPKCWRECCEVLCIGNHSIAWNPMRPWFSLNFREVLGYFGSCTWVSETFDWPESTWTLSEAPQGSRFLQSTWIC